MNPNYATFRERHWLPRQPGVIHDLVAAERCEELHLANLMAASHGPVNVDRYFGQPDSLDKADRVRLEQPEQAALVLRLPMIRADAGLVLLLQHGSPERGY